MSACENIRGGSKARQLENLKDGAAHAARFDGGARGALTRQDLVQAVGERCKSLSKREIKSLVDSVIEEMTATLARGETLKLHDFGSFVVRGKGHRAGRNP